MISRTRSGHEVQGGAPPSLTIIILTLNEQLHIRRCIESVQGLAQRVVVVDSGSMDDTVQIARSLGAEVVEHPFVNHASQMNWTLDNAPIETQWVMRLDADEYLDETLLDRLPIALADAPMEVAGFEVKRPTTFLGRRIRHGGMSPWLLRFWRRGAARCEQRWMDEHMVLHTGTSHRLSGNIVDDNLNNLTWWTEKHNRYANREALDLILLRRRPAEFAENAVRLRGQSSIKRYVKERIYIHLPPGVRPWLFFAFRMIVLGGILDGYRGMMFHTLQGLWYRQLVDAKVMQVQWLMRYSNVCFEDAVREVLGIDLHAVNEM